eukprot:3107146-Rhodomonas_salina.1
MGGRGLRPAEGKTNSVVLDCGESLREHQSRNADVELSPHQFACAEEEVREEEHEEEEWRERRRLVGPLSQFRLHAFQLRPERGFQWVQFEGRLAGAQRQGRGAGGVELSLIHI